MTIDMSQFYEAFFDESDDLLDQAEHLLLGLDIENPDIEELNAVFRAAHSIKGGAATFGFMDMTEITHVLETLLDKIRKNELALTAEHIDAFLSAKDALKMQLDGHRLATAVDENQVAAVKETLKKLSEDSQKKSATTPAENPKTDAVAHVNEFLLAPLAEGLQRFDIQFTQTTVKDFDTCCDELALLGNVNKIKSDQHTHHILLDSDGTIDDILSIASFVVKAEAIKVKLFDNQQPAEANALKINPEIKTTASEKSTSEVSAPTTTNIDIATAATKNIEPTVEKPKIEKVKVDHEVGYGLYADDEANNVEEGYGFFAPFIPHKDAVIPELVDDHNAEAALVKAKANTGEEKIVATNTVSPPTSKPAIATSAAANTSETTSIRVGVEKVDQLINLVGELVITQAMIQQRISHLESTQHEPLFNSVAQLTRNTRDLQEAVMSIRMMPMDFVFSRFPRMVRDLATKLSKKIEFVTVGATTELDKGLIERIVDPLTHLVRNSVDHGIETPEQRKKSGKSDAGTLTLTAAHKGGNVVIEVTDDGAGLNRDKLLAKARSNGLNVSDSMTDTEVFQLIFAPGFSTAEVVTDVSGRGVGMDVVKRNISAMGGIVEIRSVLGYGTTVSIALPLTLAILDGMSVSLGRNLYVIPLNLIVETMQPSMDDITTVTGQGLMVKVRGEYLPIIPLYALFNQDTEITHPTEGVLIILEAEGKKAALFVDGLLGQQQVVIKSLETNFKKINGVSGATIMGDGSVALIIDVPAIIKMGQPPTKQVSYKGVTS